MSESAQHVGIIMPATTTSLVSSVSASAPDNRIDCAKASCTSLSIPKGPCSQIVYNLGPMYLYRDYFKAKVYLFGTWILRVSS